MTARSGRPARDTDLMSVLVLVLPAAIAWTTLIAVDVSLSAVNAWSHSPFHVLAVGVCIVLSCIAIGGIVANRLIRSVRTIILEAEQRAVIRLDSLRHGQVEQLVQQREDTGDILAEVEKTTVGGNLDSYARGYADGLSRAPMQSKITALPVRRRT